MFAFEERGHGSQPRSGATMEPTAHAVGYGGQMASPNGAKKCFLARTDGPAGWPDERKDHSRNSAVDAL